MIPFRTDAPIYHWPIATAGLIIANIAATIAAFSVEPEVARRYLLIYGEGLHPVQWITSNFIHAGLLHLIGNMIYLWGFGLIVEGKVGWWRFLGIYLGIGVAECALEQSLMLQATQGASLGASSIIYGLIAISMVWAPRNEVGILLIYGWGFMIRTAIFDLSIVSFALIYFALETISTVLSGFAFGSPMLHLFGVVIGFVVGTVMVQAGWVDCEEWDLYSLWAKNRDRGKGKRKKKSRRRRSGSPDEEGMESAAEARSAEALAQLRGSIEAGAPYEALAAYQALVRMPQGWRPLERDQLGLIRLLQAEKLVEESLPIMEGFLEQYPGSAAAARVRLRLAQVLLRERNQPARALRLLAGLDEATLPADLRPVRRRIEQEAIRRRDDEGGSYELEDGR